MSEHFEITFVAEKLDVSKSGRCRNVIKTKKNYSFQCRIGHMNEVGMCYGYNILRELNAYKI